ncbi:MAG: FAD-dependent oxidoreductase [Gemmatimonadota bacterium]
MKRILVLGAGFGGLETVTGLAAALDDGYEITLVDRRDAFFIGFSKIDVLFGRATPRQVSYRYDDLRAEGVRFVHESITAIHTDRRVVRTTRSELEYDYLVVALGADLVPEAVPGFVESGGHEFYSMWGAEELAPVLADFRAGTLVLGILRTPYKCPPAPYEVACQLHDFFVARGVRNDVELKMVIPGPRPVKSPDVSDMLEEQLSKHGVELISGSPIQSIDADARRVVLQGRTASYDLFVGVPVHAAPAVVRSSPLGGDGFVRVDRETLETAFPDVYAVGDVTNVPVADRAVPKAGAFAEEGARTVVSDILRKEGRGSGLVPFEGRGACYFELGSGAVAEVAADFLGGDAPRMAVSGPSDELRSHKEDFAASRRDRWFRSVGAR